MLKQGMAIGTALVGVLSLAALPTFAADLDDHDTGFYLGAGVGDFSASLQRPSDATKVHLDFKNNDAYRVFGGWRFNPYLSVQLDYDDFGHSAPALGELGLSAKSDAWTPAVKGTLPLGPIELFGKVGEMFSNVRLNTNGGQAVTDTGNHPLYGVGIGGTILKRLNLSAEYERIKMPNLRDADAVWLNASWRFAAFR